MANPIASYPPPCNLCNLPAELKARIVELCSEQDEVFREWVKSRPNVGAELKQKQTWHGRSVSALFGVSKEFSTHAAPYLFRVLKASKFDLRLKCADPTLRHLLFRELNLDSAELGKLTDIIAILPQLVGVKKLVISDKALRQLWGGEEVTFDELSLTALTAQYSAAIFKRLCHLEEISTTDVSPQKLSPIVVNSASTLRILRLIVPVHAIQWFSLGEILSSSTALQELNIDFRGDRTSSLSADLALLRPYLSTTPPLRTLFLSSDFLNSSFFDFCTSFSSTLAHLSLTTTGGIGRGIYSGPQLTTHTFPHVTHFALEDYSYTLRTLQSIRPSHFPSLAKLTFSVVDLEDWEETPFPLRALNLSSFPTLTTLSLPDYPNLPFQVVEEIDAVCEETHLRLEEAEPFDPESVLNTRIGTAQEMKVRRLRTTLAYVQAEVDKAEAANDAATLNRLRTALEGFETERVASAAWERA